MSCGADTTANALIESLTEGKSFVIPQVDLTKPEFQFPYDPNGPLYTQVKPLTVDQLTTRVPGGSGVFDALMDSFRAHLKEEMEKGRITGAEYTKTYIALSESAMNQAAAFILGKDEAFWQAQTAQIGALTARVELETAKVNLAGAQLQALNQEAVYALTKLKLATEDIAYCTSKLNLESLMPLQIAGQELANSTADYNLNKLSPQQLINLQAQQKLIAEQMEAQRGQTHDLRSDNIPVAGVMGKQKLLYTQQVTSYQRDAEVKAAKIFTDAWITQKTIDEGLLPPPLFNNTSVDGVLQTLKASNGFS